MNEFESVLATMIAQEDARHIELTTVLHFLMFTPGIHLTGSRSFGTEYDGSDYDFFVREDSNVMLKLRELGFVNDWNSGYSDSDPTVHLVMVFNSGDVQIHIQLIKDYWFDKKIAAQAKIKELYFMLPEKMRCTTKDEMKKIWRAAIVRA